MVEMSRVSLPSTKLANSRGSCDDGGFLYKKSENAPGGWACRTPPGSLRSMSLRGRDCGRECIRIRRASAATVGQRQRSLARGRSQMVEGDCEKNAAAAASFLRSAADRGLVDNAPGPVVDTDDAAARNRLWVAEFGSPFPAELCQLFSAPFGDCGTSHRSR